MYLQSLSGALDQSQDAARQPKQGGANSQTRRLMETSNMFTVYRNSLKNNLNNNSNAFAEQNSFNPGPQHFSEPNSKQGTAANVGGQHLYQTARQGGFYQDSGRANQRKISDMSANVMRSSDVQANSPMHDTSNRFHMT